MQKKSRLSTLTTSKGASFPATLIGKEGLFEIQLEGVTAAFDQVDPRSRQQRPAGGLKVVAELQSHFHRTPQDAIALLEYFMSVKLEAYGFVGDTHTAALQVIPIPGASIPSF